MHVRKFITINHLPFARNAFRFTSALILERFSNANSKSSSCTHLLIFSFSHFFSVLILVYPPESIVERLLFVVHSRTTALALNTHLLKFLQSINQSINLVHKQSAALYFPIFINLDKTASNLLPTLQRASC